MADDVAVTAGSGTTIGADERTINSVAVKVQRVVVEGGTAFATGQVSISNTAVSLLAARETRKHVIFVNRQLEAVYIGPATVTTANGLQLDPGDSIEFDTTALIQGITSAATVDATREVHYLESYDA
jgi:hypothetical protein